MERLTGMTRFTARHSRFYNLMVLLIVGAIGGTLFWTFHRSATPQWVQIFVAFFAGVTVLGPLWGLLAGGKTILADGDGLNDRRLKLGAIPWSAIHAFRHMPKIDKETSGETTLYLREGWRPILLWADVSTSRRPWWASLSSPPAHADFPGATPLRIEFMGLDESSEKLVEMIRQRAPQAKEIV